MRGLQVKCPTCGIVRHVTTEHYQPDQTPKGNFIELIDPWKTWRWNCYDDEGEGISTTPAVMMCCPGCSAPLVLNGRLTIAVDKEKQKAKRMGRMVSMWDKKEVSKELEKLKDIKVPLYYAPGTPEFVCDVDGCGKVCKSKAGLGAHQRSHKEKGNA